MLNAIAKPFGKLLMWLYEVLGNYGFAILVFALLVKLIFLPFQMKSKKSMMRLSRMQPRVNDIQKRYAGNQQKANEELKKLYEEENVNPSSGCLWSFLPLPILIALYQAIRFPITIMMGVASDAIAEGGVLMNKLTALGFSTEALGNRAAAYIQIHEAKFISEHWDAFEGLVEKLRFINFDFLGIDLGATPDWKFFFSADWSSMKNFWPGFGLFLIPVIAAVLTWLSSKAASAANKGQENDQTKGMTAMMPFMTLVFAFMMPSSMGLYWAAGSLFGIIQDLILNKHYNKILDAEDAVNIEKRKAREAELEAKRAETERLKAEGNTVVNPNTSKRKQQQKEQQERDARAAEYEKKKAIQRGEQVDEEPGRVGDRKYARGRAYDPDRYKKQAETAAEEPKEEGLAEE